MRKHVKILGSVICLLSIMFFGFSSDIFFAEENDDKQMISVQFNMDELEVGNSFVLYENETGEERIVVEVLPTTQARGVITGTGSWSQGYIEGNVITMYVHYENAYEGSYSSIGYYVTYDVPNKTILATYGATVSSPSNTISNVATRIITATPTASVTAKSEMTWIVKKYGDIGTSSCYLRQEINNNNQMRICWCI